MLLAQRLARGEDRSIARRGSTILAGVAGLASGPIILLSLVGGFTLIPGMVPFTNPGLIWFGGWGVTLAVEALIHRTLARQPEIANVFAVCAGLMLFLILLILVTLLAMLGNMSIASPYVD